MPLAGVTIERGDRGPAQVAADDISTRFEAVISERGPVGVPLVSVTWAGVRSGLGGHTAFSTLRAVEQHFAEGGGRAVLSRVVGPSARAASLDLVDGSAGVVLTVTAAGPGAWYHAVRITVERAVGDDRDITVTLDGATLASGTATDEQDAQDIIARAGLVSASIGAGTWPIAEVADRPLAGGDDDRANIRDAQVIAALGVFDADLGAGSVAASGWTSVEIHTALADHAAARNRFARGDLPDVSSAATLIAHAAQVRALDDARHIQLLAGWPTVDVAGVTLPVPPSGPLTGREALTDLESGPGPGQPCAWSFGEMSATGVSQEWSRADREAMLDAGITIIVQGPQGAVYAEDAITAADSVLDPAFREVSAMRVTMAVHQQAERVLRQRVMQVIDGAGHLTSAAAKDLVAICADHYQAGALYGAAADEAFSVSVTADAARRSLTGHLLLRPSPSAQTVQLTITQVAAGDTI